MNPLKIAGESNPQESGQRLPSGSTRDARREAEEPASVPETPLTGRDTELSLLRDRWEQAQEGMGQVVLISGEPGLGKSRLAQTITKIVQDEARTRVISARENDGAGPPVLQNLSVVEWRCSQHFQNSEFSPISDFMERFLEFARDDPTSTRFDRLARHLEEYDLGQPEVIGLFAKLLFLPPDERYLSSRLTPAREREETFRVLRRWLRVYSVKRPLLFVVEDLHWSDASTLEFLGQFIGEGPQDRILAVLTFRPEFRIPWPTMAHQTILGLNRLTRRQVTQWMQRDSGGVLPESLVAQIYQRTRGVPLLVEEFTRMVRESTVPASTSDRRPPAPSDKVGEIPTTLQHLVLSRLDRGSSDCEVAQLAATLGREFDYDLLAAVVTLDEVSLQAELAKLISAGILRSKGQPPKCAYLFKHALLEEALYGSIDTRIRQQFHLRVAEALETRITESVETQPERLAEHFTKAGNAQKAVAYYLKAGLRSRDRFANVEAVSHFTNGLKLLETLDHSSERDIRELEFLGPLGTSYIAWRGYAAPEVGPIFRRARLLCERVDQTPRLFAIMWGDFAFHIVRGDFRICSELADEAMTFGERLNDPGILMEALFLRGITRFYRGDFARARDCFAQALDRYDDRDRTAFWAALVGQDAGVTHRCYLALAWWHLGFPDRALKLNQEMLELARSMNQPFSLEYALHHTGWFHQNCRLGVETQASGDEQIRIATDQGFLFWQATGTLYAAAGLVLQGRLAQGLRLMQKGLEAYRATGAELALPYYLGILADACTQTGRFAEARAALSEALALVEKNDERVQEPELHRLKGELVLAELGDQTAAEKCFRLAAETARRYGSRAWELRACIGLARLWQKQDRHEEALAVLSGVHGAFTEGFTIPDLTDAAELLESLSNHRMRADFDAGVKYVRDCIPMPMDGLVSVDWRYIPASTLGGDAIGYHWLDDDHLALYLIDVTGHGLDSALLAVSVTNMIRAGALPGADMKRPDHVLTRLNEAFRGQEHGNKYFTIWYGVYQAPNRTMTWAGGGHPPAILLVSGEPDPLVLRSESPMMGVLPELTFTAQSCVIPVDARLLIFSDGVFEIFRNGREVWSLVDCIAYLAVLGREQGSVMDELLSHVQHLHGSPRLRDDFSIIEARFH